jgi:2-polyprenyl-6-methoxyphenol hydroxylase-like FAD-dependent oxidoreductase
MLGATSLSHCTAARKRAVIAGAGPGGLAATIALQQAGFAVTLCDQNGALPPAGSGLTLWPNALRALHSMGLDQEVASRGVSLAGIAMRNWRGDLIFSDSVLAAAGDKRFPGIGLTRTSLIDALSRRVDGPTVLQKVVRFTAQEHSVIVRLADGRELACDLLVGADGLHSRVRAQLVGDQHLDYAGYVVTRGIADGDFAGNTGTVWMGPARQFGAFPLPQNQTYWFASEKSCEGNSEAPRPIAAILESLSGWAPPVLPIVRATPEDKLLRNRIYDRPTLRRWSFGHVTMLGDAAHPAAPTLGQGCCQAIEDAVTLGRCCAEEQDIGAALQNYQARRLARANSFVREARLMGKLGLWQNSMALYVRETMMRVMPVKFRQSQLARTFDFRL